MHQYRVTKYDPKYRNDSGVFMRDDWTCCSEIGGTFDGVILTPQKYLHLENAYVQSALAFFAEANIHACKIRSLENHTQYVNSALPLVNGRSCSMLEVSDIVRLNLRSLIWCRLVGDGAFLHFGYDFYMYVGVPIACSESIEFATRSGLFVEPFESPYNES